MVTPRVLFGLPLLAFLFTFATAGIAQRQGSALTLQASAGAYIFDENLGLRSSPSFGFGIGRDLTPYFKIAVDFAMSSTHRDIAGAASNTRLDVRTYHYFLSAQLSKAISLVRKMRPFLTLGVGGILFVPQSVELSLGGGETVRLEPSPDHKTTLQLGGGFSYSLGKRLSLSLKYQMLFFRMQDFANLGADPGTVTARSDYLGLGLITVLN